MIWRRNLIERNLGTCKQERLNRIYRQVENEKSRRKTLLDSELMTVSATAGATTT